MGLRPPPWTGRELICGIILVSVPSCWEFSYLCLDVWKQQPWLCLWVIWSFWTFPVSRAARRRWQTKSEHLPFLSEPAPVEQHLLCRQLEGTHFYCKPLGQVGIASGAVRYHFLYICEKPKVRQSLETISLSLLLWVQYTILYPSCAFPNHKPAFEHSFRKKRGCFKWNQYQGGRIIYLYLYLSSIYDLRAITLPLPAPGRIFFPSDHEMEQSCRWSISLGWKFTIP